MNNSTRKDNTTKYTIIAGILTILLIIGIIFVPKLLKGKSNNNSETSETISPLMYEITKNGSNNKIYLFGSIHVADKNNFNYPEYVLSAYQNSHYLACEFDMIEYQQNSEKAFQLVDDLMYKDNTSIKDHLSKDTYTKMVNLLKEKEMYMEAYDIYKPYFFQSLLTNSLINDAKLYASRGIDLSFLTKAKKDNKKILEIESPDYQNNLFLSFSDKIYEIIISEVVNNYNEEVESLKDLFKAWKNGNTEMIMELASDEIKKTDHYTSEQIQLINDYNNKLIKERNIKMTEKLEEYFNNNYDTFYMVGAAHLIGDDGIVKLLQNQGYNVILKK